MTWIESLQAAIKFMEDNLYENPSLEQIAATSGYSSSYLQKGFKILTGYSLNEYMKNRKLYLGAVELSQNSKLKVIDAALLAGYDSSDAFAKAFKRFHGHTIAEIRSHPSLIQPFYPLQIQISVKGGKNMDYRIVNVPSFKVIGISKTFDLHQDTFQEIPLFWNEFMERCQKMMNCQNPQTKEDKAIWENNIGEFGICIEKENGCEYIIAGKYRKGDIPQGYSIQEIPAHTWAIFECVGPVPAAIQQVSTQIFKEWLLQNPQYTLSGNINMEWYSMGNNQAADYKSQVWIPVQESKD